MCKQQRRLFKNDYQTIEVNDLEIVLCSIRPLHSRPIIIGSVYRPPNNNSFKNTFVEFMDKTDFTNAEVYLERLQLSDKNKHREGLHKANE